MEAIYSSLAFLNRPHAWIPHASEKVTISQEELSRTVRLQLKIPDSDFFADPERTVASSSDPCLFNFVALRPRKGVLLTVDSPSTIGGAPARRLSHDEHIDFCRKLIRYRFLSLTADVISDAIADGSVQTFLPQWAKTFRALLTIPALDPTEAGKVLKANFTEHRSLGLLVKKRRHADEENRLYRLCSELADRYYLVFAFVGQIGSRVEIDYTYRQLFYGARPRWRDRAKSYLGAVPEALRIHVPLARMTDHYDFRMDAPPGYYFSSQAVLERWKKDEDRAVSEGFWSRRAQQDRQDDRSSKFYETPVGGEAEVYEEVGGGTAAHLLVRNGRSRERRLYARLHLRELPPGTVGLSFLTLSLATTLAVVLTLWLNEYNAEGNEDDIPALLVGLGALAPVIQRPLLPRSNIVSIPLVSRVYLFAQALIMTLLSVWFLSRDAGLPASASGNLKWWHHHGGTVLALSLVALTVHAFQGLARNSYGRSKILNQSRPRTG